MSLQVWSPRRRSAVGTSVWRSPTARTSTLHSLRPPPALPAGAASGPEPGARRCAAPAASAVSRRLPRRVATREVEMVGSVVRYQGSEEDEAGFLRRRRIGPAGRSKYLKAAGLFNSFCRDRRMAATTPAEVDHALDIYLVWLFAKQRVPLQQAREAYYGVRFAFDLQNSHLALARASLDGFKREDPDLSREPCPWEVATLVALDILEQPGSDAPLIAAAVLLDFDVYARPGALCGLECRSLIAVGGSRFCLVFPRRPRGAQQGADARRHSGDRCLGTRVAPRRSQGFKRVPPRATQTLRDFSVAAAPALCRGAGATLTQAARLHATLS